MQHSSVLWIISSCSTQTSSRKPQQTGQPVQNQTTYRYPRGKLDLSLRHSSHLRDFNPFGWRELGEFTSTLDIIHDKESSWILASAVTCNSPLERCFNPVLNFQHVSRFQCWLLQAKLLMVHYRWTGHSKRSATQMWEYRWAGIFTWIVDISIGQKLNIQIRNPS